MINPLPVALHDIIVIVQFFFVISPFNTVGSKEVDAVLKVNFGNRFDVLFCLGLIHAVAFFLNNLQPFLGGSVVFFVFLEIFENDPVRF